MPRNRKQNIEINSNDSLQSVMQEVYNNACSQIIDAQKIINEITTASNPEDVDEYSKIAKAKTEALKIKDSAIKIKLDVGKLQNEIIKHSGDFKKVNQESSVIVNKDSFAKVRALLQQQKEEGKS